MLLRVYDDHPALQIAECCVQNVLCAHAFLRGLLNRLLGILSRIAECRKSGDCLLGFRTVNLLLRLLALRSEYDFLGFDLVL